MLGSTALFLATQNRNTARLAQQNTTANNLQKAKQALIAYAVNYSDDYTNGGAGPGHLPCPDRHDTGVRDNGSPAGICGPFKPGRLPISWLTSQGKASEIYPFARSFPRRFWYVLSEDFRYSSGQIVNPATPAMLRVDTTDNIVAVIIDPGPPLAGQNRPSDDPKDYLEGGNEDGDTQFVSQVVGESTTAFNDRLVYIHRDTLMPLVETRVLAYVRQWLQDYATINGHYPTPAERVGTETVCRDGTLRSGFLPEVIDPSGTCSIEPFSQAASWFWKNQWQRFIEYHIPSSCIDITDCTVPTLTIKPR